MGLLLLGGCMRLSDIDESFSNRTQSPEIHEESKESRIMECKHDTEGTVIIEATGDKVEKMTHTFSLSFEDLGITQDLDAQSLQNKINESLSSMYADLDGVEASGKMVDSHVEITVTIDYEQADQDQLVEAGLLDEGEIESNYISFKETRSSYEGSNYACTVE